MARDRQSSADDPWDRALRLFREGSFEFVDAIRAIAEAKALAVFADKWYTDTRIEARRLLNAYLDRPFNALRHEPLVKRLFKFADNAGDDSTVARFIAKRGEGLHHIAFEVDNLTAALDELRAQDVELIDSEPRRGGGGRWVAFVHPRASHGVLLELIQRRDPRRGADD